MLFRSITRFPQVFLKTYIKDLSIYAEMYKALGVDEVYLVTGPKKLALTALTNITSLPCLGDIDGRFAEYLNSQVNDIEYDSKFLSRFWNYQALITDGQVEHITQQPLDNYFKKLLADTKQFDVVKKLGLEHEKLIWTTTFLSRTTTLARQVYYYKLHPNLDLKRHLFAK